MEPGKHNEMFQQKMAAELGFNKKSLSQLGSFSYPNKKSAWNILLRGEQNNKLWIKSNTESRISSSISTQKNVSPNTFPKHIRHTFFCSV